MIRAYVACERGNDHVLGFYYLLNTAIQHERIGLVARGRDFLDLQLVPAVYLGIIAVHRPLERQGLGTLMMADAFRRVSDLANLSGVWALTLDAIDDEAVSYYERFDFTRFTEGEREMYVTLGTIRQALEGLDDI